MRLKEWAIKSGQDERMNSRRIEKDNINSLSLSPYITFIGWNKYKNLSAILRHICYEESRMLRERTSEMTWNEIRWTKTHHVYPYFMQGCVLKTVLPWPSRKLVLSVEYLRSLENDLLASALSLNHCLLLAVTLTGLGKYLLHLEPINLHRTHEHLLLIDGVGAEKLSHWSEGES